MADSGARVGARTVERRDVTASHELPVEIQGGLRQHIAATNGRIRGGVA
jgi:hypothetical protein